MTKYKVLSTKKLEPSVIKQAREDGIDIVEQEFILIRPLLSRSKLDEIQPWLMSTEVNQVVFTSTNAVEAIKKYLHRGDTWTIPNWEVFSMSGKTKEALHPYISPERIVATAENAKALAEKIIQRGVREIVFFCGKKRRDELPNILKEAGVTVREIVLYETIETPVVVAGDIDAVLFFSPSAVKSFFSVNQLKETAVCFAIGDTTARSIADFTGSRVVTSKTPDQQALMTAVASHLRNGGA
jgi:uroporphyrinogen-III synthase